MIASLPFIAFLRILYARGADLSICKGGSFGKIMVKFQYYIIYFYDKKVHFHTFSGRPFAEKMTKGKIRPRAGKNPLRFFVSARGNENPPRRNAAAG